MIRVIRNAVALMFIGAAFIGCATSRPAFVGKWKSLGGDETQEFLPGGKLIHWQGSERENGHYTVDRDGLVRIEIGSPSGAFIGTITNRISVSGDTLTMKFSDGRSMTWRRLGK